tara:strand:- start:9971 stop:10666 length:696 start_codon:yes stop_codon:yes gene_type:complete
MSTTKKKIAEQIQRNYARYLDKENIVGTKESLDSRELHLMIEQSINKILKVQTFERFREGYVDIPRCNIIKYANQTVTSDSNNSRATVALPAIPLSLPMDMGVWSITKNNDITTTYIPIPSQDFHVMDIAFSSLNTQSSGLNASYLEQQVGYYVQGKSIHFTKDITQSALGSVTAVDLYLLVSDMSKFTDTEILPVNPEVEAEVIDDVFARINNGRISQLELNTKHENDNA